MASIRRRKHRWQAQVRRRGHPPITRSFGHRADAEAWARNVESSIDRHGLTMSRRQLQALTLGQLLRRYLEEVTPRKKSAVKETYRIKRLIQAKLASLSLANLRASDLATFRDSRLREVGTQAVRHELNLISNVFSVARAEWDVDLPHNPISTLAKPPIAQPRERRVSANELSRLLEAARKIAPDYLPNLIEWLIETAMRKGEALRLTPADVNEENRSVFLRETKNGFSRVVPLSTAALRIAEQRLELDRLFPACESLLIRIAAGRSERDRASR